MQQATAVTSKITAYLIVIHWTAKLTETFNTLKAASVRQLDRQLDGEGKCEYHAGQCLSTSFPAQILRAFCFTALYHSKANPQESHHSPVNHCMMTCWQIRET